jgi:site-specific recombinase XerD
MQYSRSKNTVKGYKHGWRKFTHWCEASGHAPLPASPATVLDFVAQRVHERRYRLSTIRTELYSIQFEHVRQSLDSPINQQVRTLVRTVARKLRERPRGKRALTRAHVHTIAEALMKDDSLMARRDHAIFLLGVASGWRRDELVSLALSDIWFEGDNLTVQLGASKTDQDGRRGRRIIIPPGQFPATCPVQATRRWLTARGKWQGALFCRCARGGAVIRKGISGCTLNLRLKYLLAAAGENPAAYGAHSMRAANVTLSAENGADVAAIMQRTGQRSVQTVMRYIRPVAPFRKDPLAGVL